MISKPPQNKITNQHQKKKSQVLVSGGFLLFLYFAYLFLGFHITDSREMSLVIAILVLMALVGFWYYLNYRWGSPEWQHNKIHGRIMLWVSSILLGISISIWWVQNQTLPVFLLTILNRWFPLLHDKPVDSYQRYYPLINLLLLTSLIALLTTFFFWIFERIKRSELATAQIRRTLLINYALVLVSISTCVFCTDALEQGPGQKSIIFYGGTETYVTDRLNNNSLSFIQDIQEYGGFMYGNDPDQGFQVYLSSTGFYASLLKLGQSVTKINPDDFIKGCRVFFAFILAGMFSLFSLALKKKFGWIVSFVFSGFTLITYWIIGPAGYLIWFYFLLFIPFFLATFLYPRVLKHKWTQRRFLWLIFISEVLLYLRGYTYLPGLILSAAIPVFFYELQARRNLKELLWICIRVCLMGLAAFGVVILVHFGQLWHYIGDFQKSYAYLLDRAFARSSSGDTNLQTPLMIFNDWLGIKVFYISKRFFALFPQFQAGFDKVNNFANFHLLAFGAAFISLCLAVLTRVRMIRSKVKLVEVDTLFSLGLTLLAAMIASWSWFPALGHMAHHYHMNGIMFMVPFGLTLFVMVGLLLQTFLRWLFVGKED